MQDITIVEVSPIQKLKDGDYIYRSENPFSEIARSGKVNRVISITNLHPNKFALMARADLLVLNNICDPDILPVIQHRKIYSLPTVFEIQDDITNLQPWNPVYSFYRNKQNQQILFKTIEICDALQANNEELLRKYGQLNAHTKCFPNHLNTIPEINFDKHPEDSRIRIGWAGSFGHYKDVKSIAAELGQWLNDTENVVFHLMGAPEIFDLFSEVEPSKIDYKSPGSLDEYYQFLTNLDIGIGPLVDTDYNRCRSDIKFVEYAGHGVVAAMQKLNPYENTVRDGENGFLFSNSGELLKILNRIISDESDRRRIASNAYDYVCSQRLEYQNVKERIRFYTSLVSTPPANPLPEQIPTQVPAAITEFEEKLYLGLIQLDVHQKPMQASAFFKQASEIEPKNYLPFLFQASCIADENEKIAVLEKAITLNRFSLQARIQSGNIFIGRQQYQNALQKFKETIQIFSGWNIPYIRAAEVMEKLHIKDNAQVMYQHAKQHAVAL